MPKELRLQRLVFLDENILNPFCPIHDKELSGYLITQEQLVDFFSQADLGYLFQNELIKQSRRYAPKLVIFLCRECGKERSQNEKL